MHDEPVFCTEVSQVTGNQFLKSTIGTHALLNPILTALWGSVNVAVGPAQSAFGTSRYSN